MLVEQITQAYVASYAKNIYSALVEQILYCNLCVGFLLRACMQILTASAR
jgi:hypothetical protein